MKWKLERNPWFTKRIRETKRAEIERILESSLYAKHFITISDTISLPNPFLRSFQLNFYRRLLHLSLLHCLNGNASESSFCPPSISSFQHRFESSFYLPSLRLIFSYNKFDFQMRHLFNYFCIVRLSGSPSLSSIKPLNSSLGWTKATGDSHLPPR